MITMRRFAKTVIANALTRTGADGLFGALAGSSRLPVVLGYHRVVADVDAHTDGALPGMMITRKMLAHHLDWLGRSYRFVSLDEMGERLARGEDRDEPLAAVTFDDGYQDVYEHAFPLLREKEIPAAVFVVTDLIGTSIIPLHDVLYALLASSLTKGFSATRNLGRFLRGLDISLPTEADVLNGGVWSPFAATRVLLQALRQSQVRRVIDALQVHVEIDESALRAHRPLTWEMIAEMSRAGITLGSHSRSHPALTRESAQTVLAEVAGSRQALEHKLGTPVRHFAYPGGHFNPAVVRAVAESGYRFGYTICRHRDPDHPLLTIPRMMLWEASCMDTHGRFSPAIMSCQTHRVINTPCRDSHDAAASRV